MENSDFKYIFQTLSNIYDGAFSAKILKQENPSNFTNVFLSERYLDDCYRYLTKVFFLFSLLSDFYKVAWKVSANVKLLIKALD